MQDDKSLMSVHVCTSNVTDMLGYSVTGGGREAWYRPDYSSQLRHIWFLMFIAK